MRKAPPAAADTGKGEGQRLPRPAGTGDVHPVGDVPGKVGKAGKVHHQRGIEVFQRLGLVADQQLHLDFDVADLDAGEREVLALGARKTDFQPGRNFRVFLDPAGHPFCLVLQAGDETDA